MAGENINRRINIWINDKQVVNSSRGIGRAMRQTKNEIDALDASAADYDAQLAKLTARYKVLERQHIAFKNQLKDTPGILGKIKGALGPVATGMLAAFSIQGLVTGFVNKVREAGRIIIDFNQKQANLAGAMGKSRSSILGLTYDAIKYGASTEYSAAEVSDLQIELAKLGKTQGEIRGMTKAVLESATALEAGLGPAAELIGGQLNSYSAGANEAQRFSDIMANSVNMSATSFESLSTALPKVSKVAAINNVTFEKLNGTLGVLADNNIAAETAGTGFRNILLTAADAGKNYEAMLREVNQATDKTAKATQLFGKENATVAVIMATSTDKINANTKALENSAGAAAKLAKEKMNSISGAAKNFSSAWEGMILNIEKGDGVIGKTLKGFIDFGTTILGLVSPVRKLSDELRDQQVELNMLVSKITSTNTKEDERLQLINQLKEEYPEFNELINVETASNEDLEKALIKVNEQYINRIALQKQVEKIEELSGKAAYTQAERLKVQTALFKKLNELNSEYNLKVKVDFGDLEKSAADVKRRMKETGTNGIFGTDFRAIDNYLERIKSNTFMTKTLTGVVEEEIRILELQKKELGLLTEAERAEIQTKKEKATLLEELREKAISLGLAEAKARSMAEADLKKWVAAEEERRKLSGESEEEKKAREKRKKQLEDWAKDEESLQKQLLETQRAATDARLDVLADGFDKELQLINEQYARKEQDIKDQVAKEGEEIKKLKAAQLATTDKQEIAHYQKLIDGKLEMQKALNEQLVPLEKKRLLEVAALQEKHLKKEFQRAEEAKQAEINSLKVKQNYELAEFTSLQNAKAVLSDYLSAEELRKVTTLEQAKKKIKEEHQKQELAMQERHVLEMIAQVQALFAIEQNTGITLISPEHREELLAFVDKLNLKLSEIAVAGADPENPEEEGTKKNFAGGIDILGTSAEDWERIFTSMDTLTKKAELFIAVTTAMQQAVGQFFNYLDARDQASLQKYERNTDKRKKALANQLEKGFITQEVYNARVEKLDLELEKKRMEIEYKTAKRQKIMAAANIVMQTAQAIMGIWAQFPKVDFGATAAIMSKVVAGLGAAQLAAVIATPLPPKGYRDGGYTGDGNINDIAGPVHKGEYVIPNDVLFDSDPVVPNIVGYLEAKRKRKRGFKDGGETSDDVLPAVKEKLAGQATGGAADTRMIEALERNNDLLQYLIDNGIDGFIVLDSAAAKKIQKETQKLERIQKGAKIG